MVFWGFISLIYLFIYYYYFLGMSGSVKIKENNGELKEEVEA